jgi:dual specificity MAP kinase phosphatase
MKKIQSIIQFASIHIQRQFYQLRRELTGKPDTRKTMVTPQLYVGGAYKVRGLQLLKKWGVTAVVNMRKKSFQQASHADWLDYLHLPTQDLTPPSIEKLNAGVAFIQRHISNGGKVYVHCRWGEGRGPSMAAAYLISTGMTTEDAITSIKQVRPFISLTKVQREQLENFERILQEV